ncbi:ImmA/IrrE family metallo-endopeptidase [Paenibacillus sp. MMS18-CY102]|uniref:ImmA/IrrE family metallo-endopeptidase n=1 Tax=Paenibacillus sp. MMS18-CY102 TaxID=2682849 RepID=UPI001365622F|nr:ImmA/IrrE family metallo-endopeptidase [Paenibacillus sp. MMS18-CY102]MWC29202.1 ImmA/IrrE family metallo-endopeptidase [Paenibacillus sp. MMS18-CY102]
MLPEIHSRIYKTNENYRLAKIRASSARKKYGIENGPIKSPVFSYLEQENCYVVTYGFNKKANILGMYIKQKETKIVLIHRHRILGNQNFTAAHELSHVLFDEEDMLDVCVPEGYSKDSNEILADFFASHFLMPEESILNEYNWGTFEVQKVHILRLSAKYQVSFIAMSLRLYNLGIITNELYQNYLTKSKKGKLKLVEACEAEGIDPKVFQTPVDSYISENYIKLLLGAYHSANISRSVMVDHFIAFLEKNLETDLKEIVARADSTYPDEVGWDEL